MILVLNQIWVAKSSVTRNLSYMKWGQVMCFRCFHCTQLVEARRFSCNDRHTELIFPGHLPLAQTLSVCKTCDFFVRNVFQASFLWSVIKECDDS